MPDLICELHGVLYRFCRRSNGYMERYCNECKRERRRPATRRLTPYCEKRHHPKTPWNWRVNRTRGRYYCHACAMERRKEQRAA